MIKAEYFGAMQTEGRAARRMIAEKAPAAAFLRGAEAPGNGRADAGKRTDAHRRYIRVIRRIIRRKAWTFFRF